MYYIRDFFTIGVAAVVAYMPLLVLLLLFLCSIAQNMNKRNGIKEEKEK